MKNIIILNGTRLEIINIGFTKIVDTDIINNFLLMNDNI